MKLMRKYILASCVITIMLFTSVTASAADLDVERCAINAVQNSSTIKAQQDTVNDDQDSLNSVQKITNPGMIMSQYRAQDALYEAENTLNVMTNEVRLQAYDEYNNLLKAKDSYDTQTQLMTELKQNLDSAQSKLKQGKAAEVDVKTLQINYQIEQIKLNQYKRDMDLETIKLNYLMGVPMTQRYENLADYNIIPDKSEIEPVDTYIDSALKARSEILNQQSGTDLQKKQYDSDVVNHPDKTDIFYTESQYDFDKSESDMDTDQVNVKADVMNAYSDLQNGFNALDNAEGTLADQKTLLDKDALLYKNGKMNEIDYSKDQTDYINDEIALKSAQRDLWMLQKKFECAVGIGPAYSGSGGTAANTQNSD